MTNIAQFLSSYDTRRHYNIVIKKKTKTNRTEIGQEIYNSAR